MYIVWQQCRVYSLKCILSGHSVQFTVYNVYCLVTVYSLNCTMYNVQCTLYSVQCTQCTLRASIYVYIFS